MTILNIAYPFSPVSDSTAGGAEQIVHLLDEHLVNNDFISLVAAHKDSIISGKHYKINLPGKDINSIKDEVYAGYKKLISRILKKNDTDLIHMHGIDFYEYIPETDIPVLVTLHLPPDWYPGDAFNYRKNVFFNCVSWSQQKKMPAVNNLRPFIPNGIRIHDFKLSPRKENFILAMGRVCWEKGFHFALEAARSAGVPLFIAGEIYNFQNHKEYYESMVKPLLDGKDYQFLGPVDFDVKRELLSCAQCLLIPSLADETSSLVAMEALASGTPVIAFNRGALPEIIEDSKTGYIVNNAAEMAKAIKRINRISPQVCRSTAMQRFSSINMTNRYTSVYESLVKNSCSFYNSCS